MANEGKQDDQERYENEVIQLHTVVGASKREKKNVKSSLKCQPSPPPNPQGESKADFHSVNLISEVIFSMRLC